MDLSNNKIFDLEGLLITSVPVELLIAKDSAEKYQIMGSDFVGIIRNEVLSVVNYKYPRIHIDSIKPGYTIIEDTLKKLGANIGANLIFLDRIDSEPISNGTRIGNIYVGLYKVTPLLKEQ
jgi:hypothetical protein